MKFFELRSIREAWSNRVGSCAFLRGECGGALVEISLLLSVFGLPLLLGTAQTSMYIYESIEVQNAASAGAMYGMQSSTYASDATGIATAARNEASGLGSNLTVTPITYYACSQDLGGAQYTTQSAAATACTGSGNHSLQFVQVLTSSNVTSAIHAAGLPASWTVKGQSVMEVEE